MFDKVDKNMAPEYIISSITYLDEEPNNFVAILHNINNKEYPAIRAIVKYKKHGILSRASAKVSVIKRSEAVVTDEAKSIIRNLALTTVDALCRYDSESEKG